MDKMVAMVASVSIGIKEAVYVQEEQKTVLETGPKAFTGC